MAATPTYKNLAKLGRVQLPTGTEYALIDVNGRELIAPVFSPNVSYEIGDYVIYEDELYCFITNHPAGPWNPAHVEKVTVSGELKEIKKSLVGGVHYRGKTTTPLYEGSETNPITINGVSYTAEHGDLVTLKLFDRPNDPGVALQYAVATAYNPYTYIKNEGKYYCTISDITASENSSLDAIASKIVQLNAEPEFIFDGTIWNEVGGISGLGDLAFKDSAQGTYTAPTGDGTVTVNDYSASKKKLSTTTIWEVASTVSVSKMTSGTAISVAKAGTAVRYGTADVGTEVTYGTANKAASPTTVGNANVGQAVVYGIADVGSAVSVATAGNQVVYGTANVGAEVIYGTANVGAAVNVAEVAGSESFAIAGVIVGIDPTTGHEDCLKFTNATTHEIWGVASTPKSITPAVQSTTKLTPAVAAPTTQKLTPVGGTTDITPAVAAASSRTLTPAVQSTTSIYGAVDSTSKLTPAVAAPNNQTIVPAVSNGTIVPWTGTDHTVAIAAASSAKTVATGSLENGDQIVVGITGSASTKTVTVGLNEDAIVTVR